MVPADADGPCSLRSASVVVVAVRVGVGITVVVALSSLCLGWQRFRLNGQRLDDSPRLFHHFDLSGVGRGIIQQGGAAGQPRCFGWGTRLVGREAR